MNEQVKVDVGELVELGAVDSLLFCRTFFPKTARQDTPPMHRDIWGILDDPSARYVNILMSRGWAKTSILRMFAGKRIGYNISRTILVVGASEKHSRRTIRWIRNQVDSNKLFSETFNLRAGTPWTDEEAQIIHGVDEQSIWITGLGVTSSSGRGINFDDYRPDLILLDDIMNDENSATPEGREKIINLVFGAFKESLAARSEAPLAKMVLLNTPQDYNDISQLALKDPQFVSARYGCWTKDTEDMPLEHRISAWPALVPTAELQDEYRAAAARNRLSIFVREKECKLVAPENSAFRAEWLQYFGESEEEKEPEVANLWTIMVVDPVPPPSDIKLAKGIIDGDFEAMSVLGRKAGKIFLLETVQNRGHDPIWTISEFFRLAMRWNVRKVIVEAVAYQRVLAWLLKEAMKQRGIYYLIQPMDDKREKEQKIIDGLTGICSNKQLFVRRTQTEFISQFVNYSTIRKIGHDDTIETVAIGCTDLQNQGFNLPGADGGALDESDIPALAYQPGAP